MKTMRAVCSLVLLALSAGAAFEAPDDDAWKPYRFLADCEAHVINYAVTLSDDEGTLTFLSDSLPAAPRFRLSYTKSGGDSMAIKFEIAPPGKPESLKTYLQGDARRQPDVKSGRPKS
jgi:hypothetical protein